MSAPRQLDLFSGEQPRIVLASTTQCACDIMFPRHMGSPLDEKGCRLQEGHEGPHLFFSADGQAFHWENDWDCNCEVCQGDDAYDWCTLYWKVDQLQSTPRTKPNIAVS